MTLQLRVCRQGQIETLGGMEIESIEPNPSVSRVPGSPFGMALVRSQIVPVLRLGDANTCLIVGRVHGEIFGIVGLRVVGFQAEELPGCMPSSAVTSSSGGLERSEPERVSDALVEVELNVAVLLAEMKLHPPSQFS